RRSHTAAICDMRRGGLPATPAFTGRRSRLPQADISPRKHMLKLIKDLAVFAAFTLLLPLSQAQAPDDIAHGVKAFKKKDYEKAHEILKDDAEKGDPVAQLYMAWMSEDGLGTKKDTATALKLYEASASQGNATASYRLGKMYHDGDGVKKDEQIANRY